MKPDDIVIEIKPDKKPRQKWSKRKKIIVFSILGGVVLISAIVTVVLIMLNQNNEQVAQPNSDETATKVTTQKKYYSTLSGERINSQAEDSLPIYCMQIPNGNDGARPQVGLHEAKIVFEAIAEAGITRFAAIFQNPSSSIIGPIRSLRQYYLDWDTPFDCTIVHAGGSLEALNSLKAGDYRDLTESRTYMFRDYSAYRAPNNLFSSAHLLTQWSIDNNLLSSNFTSFPHYTPKQATAAKKDAIAAAAETTHNPVPLVTKIAVKYGASGTYNVNYVYDGDTNTYFRSFGNGDAHTSYTCPADVTDLKPKQNCGEPTQLHPAVVAVMKVNQWLDTDNYHQKVQTVGSGEAYIFQNGTVTAATWSKASVADQIEFKDAEGEVIRFNPGQLWISAIPNSTGTISWE